MRQTAEDWPGHVHRVLADAEARQIAYVPDSGLTRLIALCRADPTMTMVPLTSEQEGVALLAGARPGGRRGVLPDRTRTGLDPRHVVLPYAVLCVEHNTTHGSAD